MKKNKPRYLHYSNAPQSVLKKLDLSHLSPEQKKHFVFEVVEIDKTNRRGSVLYSAKPKYDETYNQLDKVSQRVRGKFKSFNIQSLKALNDPHLSLGYVKGPVSYQLTRENVKHFGAFSARLPHVDGFPIPVISQKRSAFEITENGYIVIRLAEPRFVNKLSTDFISHCQNHVVPSYPGWQLTKFYQPEQHSFKPHITIAKLDKNQLRDDQVASVKEWLTKHSDDLLRELRSGYIYFQKPTLAMSKSVKLQYRFYDYADRSRSGCKQIIEICHHQSFPISLQGPVIQVNDVYPLGPESHADSAASTDNPLKKRPRGNGKSALTFFGSAKTARNPHLRNIIKLIDFEGEFKSKNNRHIMAGDVYFYDAGSDVAQASAQMDEFQQLGAVGCIVKMGSFYALAFTGKNKEQAEEIALGKVFSSMSFK